MIASTAMSAIGSIQQGQTAKAAAYSQANAMEYNASADRARAVQTRQMAGVSEDAQRRNARATIGKQIAASSAAGAGLNSDLLRESIYNMEADTQSIRYEGELKAAGLNDQAAISMANASTTRSQGRAAETAGYMNAAGTLLNSGTSYYSGKKAGIY
jgi:hypothetical protein